MDTGISTYDKNARRQYERSTEAHNTVSITGANSSEVWGGFRVGRRAKVKILDEQNDSITATHNGFGKLGVHKRRFSISNDSFEISDEISTDNLATSYLHFAPNVKIISYDNDVISTSMGTIHITGASEMKIEKCLVSNEYNKLETTQKVIIRFLKLLQYNIYT